MALRFDNGSLRAPQYLADGTVKVEAVVTRSGVFEYRNPDGSTRREYRPKQEVFNQDSMKSFGLMAVTLRHHGLITADNRKEFGIGTVLEGIRQDGNAVIATLHIYDSEAINLLKAGMNQTSCGYEQDLIKTPGVTDDGERYDAMQTNIRGNHVAIVEVARAGDDARVRMDSATMIAGDPAKEMNMDELKKALADLAALTVRMDSVEKERDTLKTSVAKLEGERDAAIDKATKADKARQDAAESTEKTVRERIKLEGFAGRFLRTDAGDVTDVSKMTPTEIKSAIVERLSGKKLARQDAAYVDARFDAAIEDAGEADAATDTARVGTEITRGARQDGSTEVNKARDEMIKRNQSAHLPTTK